MTLTKEQRAALKRVAAYMDEMYAVASPYYGCTEDVNLLRAMIDSSDPITDVTELVELLAAGEHEQWAAWAQAILDSEPGLSDGRKAAWPGLIATPYENLSEEMKDEDRRVVHLRSQVVLDYIQQQSAEIERLRAYLEQSERVIEAGLDVIDQRAALTKSLKKEIRRLKHESKVEVKFTNSYIKRLHDAEARIKELEEAKLRSWQITEERKAALLRAYDVVSWVDRVDNDNKRHITAILGMIKEAEAGQ